MKKRVRKLVDEAKSNYYITHFNSFKGDNKRYWKEIFAITGHKNVTQSQTINIDKIVYNNVTYKNNHDIADALNEHFATVGQKISTCFPTPFVPPISLFTRLELPQVLL